MCGRGFLYPSDGGFMEIVKKVNDAIYSVVGGIPMIVILLATGLFCTFVLKGVQFTKFGLSMKNTIARLFSKTEAKDGTMTPFQALCTALASTVGTGNIAGVAGAIAIGGPGAIFWMWVSALLGMATKYSEITLAIHYREKNPKGEWVGGPMYYIRNGLGKNWKWLAAIFAVCCSLACLGIGNMTQINTIAATFNSTLSHFVPALAKYTTLINIIIGVVVAALAALVLLGGMKRIGAVTEKMIPLMSAIYIIGALVVVGVNYKNILPAFGMIFEGAFNPSAVVGGVAGMTIMKTMTKGVGRGIFSNEAGLGSAPLAHASADTDSAVKQGLYGIFEVFIDTIVICTLTALTILTSGIAIPYGVGAGAELTTAAFASVMGDGISSIFMAVAVAMFAISTILGWALYGCRGVEFLFGTKANKYYYIFYIAMILVGAVTELELVWAISDTLNCLMAIPNLIAVIALSGVVAKLTREYFAKKKDIPDVK